MLRKYDEPNTLMVETIKLIRADRRTLLELYVVTGVPFYWLKRFVAKEMKNPSVNRVQFLYEFLTSKKLVH